MRPCGSLTNIDAVSAGDINQPQLALDLLQIANKLANSRTLPIKMAELDNDLLFLDKDNPETAFAYPDCNS